jgi:hypothetical protein
MVFKIFKWVLAVYFFIAFASFAKDMYNFWRDGWNVPGNVVLLEFIGSLFWLPITILEPGRFVKIWLG